MSNEVSKSNVITSTKSSSTAKLAPKISAIDMCAFFGKVKALHNINFDIPEKKVVAIIGPSGCGKSTFLRSINRMHEVVGGTITGSLTLDGEDIMKTDAVMIRRKIGMVFQKPNPFPTMSIYNNVIAGYKLNGHHNKKNLYPAIKIGRAHV